MVNTIISHNFQWNWMIPKKNFIQLYQLEIPHDNIKNSLECTKCVFNYFIRASINWFVRMLFNLRAKANWMEKKMNFHLECVCSFFASIFWIVRSKNDCISSIKWPCKLFLLQTWLFHSIYLSWADAIEQFDENNHQVN